MQQDYASDTLLKPATLYFAFDDEEAATAGVNHRNIVRRGVSRTALHLAYVNPNAATAPQKKDTDGQTVWSKVFDFFIQGLAIGVHHCIR